MPVSSPIERIAHRGANRLRTENTLVAFDLALQQGADAIELDVHATADGMVVVHHDADIADTISTMGGRRRLAEMTWAQVKSLRLRGDERVPRLDEVFALVEQRARVYVEIKGADIEREVIRTISMSHTDCAVHSFDHAIIDRVRAIAPDIPRGLLLDKGDPQARDIARLVDRYGARDVWPHRSLITDQLVASAHRAGARIIVWTVNDADDARSLASLGVDALCSDDLPLIVAALERNGPR